MDKGNYNTYTISDSDDDLIIIKDNQTNTTFDKNDQPMSPGEPEFFRQVIQQRKRRKPSSTDTILHHEIDLCSLPKDSLINENKGIYFPTEDTESNICESVKFRKRNDFQINDNVMSGSDIYSAKNNKQTTEEIEPRRKNRLTKEEKEERKKEEIARKDAKKKLTDELKRINPKECIKYITVHIDINLQNCDYSEQMLSEIKSTDAKYEIISNQIASHSVSWSRKMSDTHSENENFMLLIWNFEYTNNLITSNQLMQKINNMKLYKKQLSIIIYSSTDQLKKLKSKKRVKSSENDMLNSLSQMMLKCGVSFRFIENKNDIGLAIVNFTNSIANRPYKLKKYKEEQEGCDWYTSGHKKNCVNVDKNGIGLSELWRQQMSQFPLCALETSEAITSAYKSPTALLEAYNKCSTRSEGEKLLQDIPVRRGFGPLAANRRIGPELSKKIYTFFTDNTGCTTISQE